MKGAPLFLLESKKNLAEVDLKVPNLPALLPAPAGGVGLCLRAPGAAAPMAAEAMGPLSRDFPCWCPRQAGQRAGSSWGQVAALFSVCSAGASRVTSSSVVSDSGKC